MDTQRVPMFTLKDLIDLSNNSSKDPIAAEQFNEAVYGGYLLTKEQAAANVQRKLTDKHLLDAGENGLTGLGIPSGKLPNHITYSKESPYAIGLTSTEAGVWTKNGEQWDYAPSKVQLSKPGYLEELKAYGNNRRDPGLGSITLPNNEVIKIMK